MILLPTTALVLLSGCSSLECPPGTRELNGICVSVEDPDAEDEYLTVDAGYALLGYREQDYAGASLDAGGDFNGDGIPDIVVGATGQYQYDYRAGEAYLVLGPVTGDRLLRDAHLVMGDDDLNDWSGVQTRFAGDLDDDGYDDLVISAVRHGQGSGHAYIGHGPTSGSMDLETEALQLSGMSDDDVAGRAIAGGHDLDGDGVIDLAVSAPGAMSMATSMERSFSSPARWARGGAWTTWPSPA